MVNFALLACESLGATNSGIGRVARLMARSLAECAEEYDLTLRGISLSESKGANFEWSGIRTCAKRRLEYVSRVQAQALVARCTFYDSLSMARAHFAGPARWRAALAWMHGVEVWEGARKDRVSVARQIPLLVTNTSYTRGRAASLHPSLGRARLCWLGTESDRVPRVPRRGDHQATVLILSRLDVDSYKGHKELISVWPAVVQRVPNATLIIAGSGPGLGQIHAWVEQSPVRSHIEMTGFIPEKSLDEVWARTNVFAMPSRGEGFGLTYIEAMRYGIPIIASKQDAGKEVNVHGKTGLNVDLDKPSELVDAVCTLLTERERAQAMGAAGFQRWEAFFTYSAFKRRFLDLVSDAGLLP